jgi:predicted nucleotidyltransferase
MIFLPRDFIETGEGLLFAVVDAVIEDGKALCFLRYGPAGKLSTAAANYLLHDSFPQYLHHSLRLNADLHAVPVECILKHHQPRKRVQALLAQCSKDGIERKLISLVKSLMEAGLPVECLGVTGSLLIGRQSSTSDIDVVVYGSDYFFQALARVRELKKTGLLADLDELAWKDAYSRRGCELSFEEYLWHERRKGNMGLIDGTKFDLALIVEDAIAEPPIDWHKAGPATIQAKVLDDSRSFEQPARYLIEHADIDEILSFTQTYTGQARMGETIQAAGQVEMASDGHKRLVVGSSREALGEFIRVI